MRFEPHQYQKECIKLLLGRPSVNLFLDMGLGKTVTALTAFAELRRAGEARRLLVVAPKRVAESVWAQEAAKWDHLRGLSFAVMTGDRARRLKALRSGADVTVCTRDNVARLFVYLRDIGCLDMFDMLVVDELSSFKNPSSLRFKALRKWRPRFRRFIGLTGTPASNGLEDLWSQVWLADGGLSLGRSLTAFRERWFTPRLVNAAGARVWEPKEGAAEEITGRIRSCCRSLGASEVLSLPPVIVSDVRAELPAGFMTKYRALASDWFLETCGEELTAANAAVLANKLLQLTGGAVYTNSGEVAVVDNTKLGVLAETAESLKAQGDNALVFVRFRHEAERVLEVLRSGGWRVAELRGPAAADDWNAGRLDFLVAHPSSCGYGLNLQTGGSTVVWFTPTWSLEEYLQANARVIRQGQGRRCSVLRIIAGGTMDEAVIRALERKSKTQDVVLEAVRMAFEAPPTGTR